MRIILYRFWFFCCFVSNYSIYRTDTWNIFLIANIFAEQSVPNLPCKHCWIRSFIIADFCDHWGRSDFWFWSTNDTWSYTSGFIISKIDESYFTLVAPDDNGGLSINRLNTKLRKLMIHNRSWSFGETTKSLWETRETLERKIKELFSIKNKHSSK